MKRALITGITGQDGRHLSEFLADKDYQVFGLIRGQNNPKAQLVQAENPALELVEGDLRDLSSLIAAVEQVQPDEVYNLGAISFVQLSFSSPSSPPTSPASACCACSRRSASSAAPQNNPIRFYQASSSEMFGKVRETPQTESTPFHPRSPYGVAKVFGHYTTVNYREAYGLHASSGILLQPRGPAARPRVRDPQGHERHGAHQARAAETITLGNLDSAARLGLRGRLRRGDVAACCSRTSPTTTSSRPARRTRIRELLDVAFAPRRLRRLGAARDARTRASSARPRSTCSSATRQRRTRSSAGARRWASRSSCR